MKDAARRLVRRPKLTAKAREGLKECALACVPAEAGRKALSVELATLDCAEFYRAARPR